MIMSWVWTSLLLVAVICAGFTGNGQGLSAAAMQGAQTGVTLAISIAGAICLWSGVGRLMERIGLTELLARLLRPLLVHLFPTAGKDAKLAGDLCANICANFLGLGNAATPPGVSAAKRLAAGSPGIASDELCRLVVLNTASIQAIPASVAAVRAGLGCGSPFDILPAVWISSLCSAGLGLAAAGLLGRCFRD